MFPRNPCNPLTGQIVTPLLLRQRIDGPFLTAVRLWENSPSAALLSRSTISFVFEQRYDVFKSFDVSETYASHDLPFQIQQMTADATGQVSTFRCQHHEKSAAIRFPNFTRNEPTVFKAIKNTGQCRSFMGKPAVEVSHFHRRGIRQHRKYVRFALRQSGLAQIIEIKSDPVCRAMNWMNKT